MSTDYLTLFPISDIHVEDGDDLLPAVMESLIATINDCNPDLLVICGTSTCKRYRGEPVNTYNVIEVGPEVVATRYEIGGHSHEVLRMANPHGSP